MIQESRSIFSDLKKRLKELIERADSSNFNLVKGESTIATGSSSATAIHSSQLLLPLYLMHIPYHSCFHISAKELLVSHVWLTILLVV